MPQMISKTSHQYDGRDLSKGDIFFAHPEFVQILIALDRAELCPAEAAAPAPVAAGLYQRRDMVALNPNGGRVKRVYTRKQQK